MQINELPDFDAQRERLLQLSAEAWRECGGMHPPAALIFPAEAPVDQRLDGLAYCLALDAQGMTGIGEWVAFIKAAAASQKAIQVFVAVESMVARYDSPATARAVKLAIQRAGELGLVSEFPESRRVLMAHFERAGRTEVWLAAVEQRPSLFPKSPQAISAAIEVVDLALGKWERYLSEGVDHPSPFGALLP